EAQGGRGPPAKLPLSFVANRGQTDSSVRFYAEGPAFAFYFTPDMAVLSLQEQTHGQALQLRWVGASADATLVPEQQRQGTVNVFKGDNRQQWQSGLPTYGAVGYKHLWPGVDMRFWGAGG